MAELHFVELAVGVGFLDGFGKFWHGALKVGHSAEVVRKFLLSGLQCLVADDFPHRRTHDAVLAATLLGHGVRTFYTRNLKDFWDAGFERIIDPLGAM